MGGRYNGGGVDMSGGHVVIPDGEYVLRIIEAEQGVTQKGDDKVTVTYEIYEGEYKLETIPFHTVVFFKDKSTKGASMALKFLKAIGEPYEGEFAWDEKNWIGKKLKAMISQEEQKEGKHAGKKFPRIKWVNPCDDGPGGVKEQEIPF
jgi:hypothetical protein